MDVTDLILCMAVLGYVTAHCRLRSLAVHIFPVDPRRQKRLARQKFGVAEQPRASRLVSRPEIGLLIFTLPVWAVLAYICRRLLPTRWGNPGWPPNWWRAMWLAWLLGSSLLVAAGFLDYWHRRRMTPPEAALFLQDVFWNETRGEQRLVNRWLAWARLRRQPRKDKP